RLRLVHGRSKAAGRGLADRLAGGAPFPGAIRSSFCGAMSDPLPPLGRARCPTAPRGRGARRTTGRIARPGVRSCHEVDDTTASIACTCFVLSAAEAAEYGGAQIGGKKLRKYRCVTDFPGGAAPAEAGRVRVG